MRIAERLLAGFCGASVVLAAGLAVSAVAAEHDRPAAAPPPAIFETACTQCHLASQVTSQHKTADQWAETVNQMIGYGAQITDDQYTEIVEYLAANYGLE